MSERFFKFPSTPHLTQLGGINFRNDKVLTQLEMDQFLSAPVIVEEKVDGANIGISFDARGRLRFQNRGNWIEGKLSGQWKQLRGWASQHESNLRSVLPNKHVLFGEWCYATHSLFYDRLPDWFIAFDVYDSKVQKFWSVARRNSLASTSGISTVPVLCERILTKEDILNMLDHSSSFGAAAREGLYLRREDGGWLLKRAKVVRPDFIQSVIQHWSRKPIIHNKINTKAL